MRQTTVLIARGNTSLYGVTSEAERQRLTPGFCVNSFCRSEAAACAPAGDSCLANDCCDGLACVEGDCLVEL